MATYALSGTGAGTYPNYTADPTDYDGAINGVVQSDTFNLNTEALTTRMTGYVVGGGVAGESGFNLEAGSSTGTITDNRVWWAIYQGPGVATPADLQASYSVGGVQSHVFGIPLAAYLRITVSGGNCLWQTSPDNVTWTTRRTVAVASLPFLASVKARRYTFGSNTSGLYSFTVISPATGSTATAPASPIPTAARSATDPTIITVNWTQGSNGGSAVLDQELKIDGGAAIILAAGVSTYTVTGQSFAAHTFALRARNAVGFSGTGSYTVPLYTPPSVGLENLGGVFDDFNDSVLDSQWVASSGVVQTGGQVFFPPPSTTPVSLYRRGNAVNQRMHFKLTPAPATDATTEFFMRSTADPSQVVRIFIRGGVIYAANEQGAADPGQSARPYSATNDLYAQIVNGSDGKTRLYTSPNANTWTELGRSNFTSPNWLADVQLGVRVYTGTAPVTPSGLPLAPASTSVENLTSTSATLVWTPPSNAATVNITGYQVSWGGWTSAITAATDRRMDLTNFTPSTTTPVSVWAVNAQGAGPARVQNIVTTGGGGGVTNPALLGLPTKVTAVYATGWGGTLDLTSIPASYNVLYPFAASKGATNGQVIWGYNVPTNLVAARARGTRVIMSCGGAGQGINFSDRSVSQAFVNSILALNTRFGGTLLSPVFDGIDFNTFEADATRNVTEYQWMCDELRRQFGSNFLITSPPAPWNETDKNFCRTLLASGAMNYAAPQYYDGPGLADPTYIINSVTDWIANVAAGNASKIVVGFGLAGGANYSTMSQILQAWNTIESRFPTIRGAFLWEHSVDRAQGWPVANQLNPLVLS